MPHDACPEDAATFLRWDLLGTACCAVCHEPLYLTSDDECQACVSLDDAIAEREAYEQHMNDLCADDFPDPGPCSCAPAAVGNRYGDDW